MDELKKNQIYEAEITGYTSTGAGVCRIGGRAVFVPLALAGEVWDVQILKVSSSAVYGKGVELKRASPARAVPDCPVFGKCGACIVRRRHCRLCWRRLLRVSACTPWMWCGALPCWASS